MRPMDIWQLATWAAERLQSLWTRAERAAETGEGSVLPADEPPPERWQDTWPMPRRPGAGDGA